MPFCVKEKIEVFPLLVVRIPMGFPVEYTLGAPLSQKALYIMAHKVRKVGIRGGYQNMEMVGHTNICQKGYIIDV